MSGRNGSAVAAVLALVRFIGGSKHNKFEEVAESINEVQEPQAVPSRKFQKGDKVKCVDSSNRPLTNGKVYTVTSARVASDADYVTLQPDYGYPEEFYARRFVLAEAPSTRGGPFKVGDKVRCIERGNNSFISVGDVLEVIGSNAEHTTVRTKTMGNHWYPTRYFELAEAPKATPPTPKPLDIKSLKKGDKVRCVKPYSHTNGGLTVGKVYEVESTYGMWVRVYRDNGVIDGFGVEYFERVEELEQVKKGDRLRCVKAYPYGNWLTVGKVYEALSDSGPSKIFLVRGDNGSSGGFRLAEGYFVLDTSAAPERYTRRRIVLDDGVSRYEETCFVLDTMTNTDAAAELRKAITSGLTCCAITAAPRIPKVITTKPLPIRSSDLISALGYDGDTETLDVTLKHSGRTYRYTGVDRVILGALLASDSLGKAYNEHVRGEFPVRQLD